MTVVPPPIRFLSYTGFYRWYSHYKLQLIELFKLVIETSSCTFVHRLLSKHSFLQFCHRSYEKSVSLLDRSGHKLSWCEKVSDLEKQQECEQELLNFVKSLPEIDQTKCEKNLTTTAFIEERECNSNALCLIKSYLHENYLDIMKYFTSTDINDLKTKTLQYDESIMHIYNL